MRWMIADTKLLFDQLCHSLSGPDGSSEPMSLRPLLQPCGKLRHLLFVQSELGTLRDFPPQSLFPLLSSNLSSTGSLPLGSLLAPPRSLSVSILAGTVPMLGVCATLSDLLDFCLFVSFLQFTLL